MKIGILGAGRMADTFAKTLTQMEQVECYAVASRSMERAENFARRHGFQIAYDSYDALVSDPAVELIYIATPHSHHYEQMKLCIEHGKPVLCEKAFTMNSRQAREIKALAEEKGVFVTEAIWTRYMPSRQIINDLLASGIIGKVYTLTANLSYVIDSKERLVLPELAGGALLDVGIYGINFALMHFGTEIERIESSVQFTNTGVDGMESITIFFKNGTMAVITSGMYARSDRQGIFYGDRGYMVVENINNPQSISVYDTADQLIKKVDVPRQISGYEYQVLECMDCLANGQAQSKSMPLDDTIFVMDVMDTLRSQWGLVYPQEK